MRRPKITELIDYEALLRCGVRRMPRMPDSVAITPRELRDLLDSGKKLALIDVREPVEWDINHIDGAAADPEVADQLG